MAGKSTAAATDKGTPGDDKTTGTSADTGTGGEDLQAEVDKWKRLARQHEDLWKSTGLSKDELPEAKTLLAKAREADVNSKTAEDRIAALERKIAEAEANSTRLEIAAAKGLTPAMARRLVGTTREELESDADELLKVMKPADDKSDDKSDDKATAGGKGGSGSGGTSGDRSRPRETLRSGAAPDAEPEENDPTKLAELIPRG